MTGLEGQTPFKAPARLVSESFKAARQRVFIGRKTGGISQQQVLNQIEVFIQSYKAYYHWQKTDQISQLSQNVAWSWVQIRPAIKMQGFDLRSFAMGEYELKLHQHSSEMHLKALNFAKIQE